MILIFSQDRFESSTDEVIDWISYYKQPFKRLNGVDFYKNANIILSNKGCDINIDGIIWEEVNVVWMRRWIAPGNSEEILIKNKSEILDPLVLQFNEHLRSEAKALTSFFFDWIPRNKTFGRIRDTEINKLIVLNKALQFGLNTPDTYIYTRKAKLQKLLNCQDLITKSISNSPAINHENSTFISYTTRCEEIPDCIEDSFTASLFQNQIKKKFEIRAFLLNGKIYSMAIFSQNDPQTKVDFRQYNHKNPNRVSVYKLPQHIEEKLIKIANYFEFKSGSFDLIKSVDNEYIFLEVNPDGQFGMVSYPCNYYLEKKIAVELITYN